MQINQHLQMGQVDQRARPLHLSQGDPKDRMENWPTTTNKEHRKTSTEVLTMTNTAVVFLWKLDIKTTMKVCRRSTHSLTCHTSWSLFTRLSWVTLWDGKVTTIPVKKRTLTTLSFWVLLKAYTEAFGSRWSHDSNWPPVSDGSCRTWATVLPRGTLHKGSSYFEQEFYHKLFLQVIRWQRDQKFFPV